MDPTVVVTGARGFVGRPLVALLRAAGRRVVALDRVPGTGPDDVALDLSDAAARAASLPAGPLAVVHLAGSTGEPADAVGRAACWAASVDLLHGLLDSLAARPAPARLLLVSSAAVYGRPTRADGVVSEDDPPAPLLFYGAAKAAQETAALWYGRRGLLDVVVARLFNPTGPGEGPGSVLGSAAAQIRSGAAELVLGNLESVRDFLDVRDAAAALALLLQSAPAGAIVNVGSGAGATARQRVDALVAAAGRPLAVRLDPARGKAADVPRIVADVTRLRALGFVPGYDPARTARDLLSGSL